MKNKYLRMIFLIVFGLLSLVLEHLGVLVPGWSWFLPSWLVLFMLFAVSDRETEFSIGMAWVLGLLSDVWLGNNLGHNCLIFTALAYLVKALFSDFKNVDPPSQAALVFVIVLLYKLLDVALSFEVGLLWSATSLTYIGTAFASAILWLIITAPRQYRYKMA